MARGVLTWWMANAPGCLTRSKGLVGSSDIKRPLPPGEGLTHEGQDTMRTTCLVLLYSWLAVGALGVRPTDAAVPHALLMDPKGIVRFEGHPSLLDDQKIETLLATYNP